MHRRTLLLTATTATSRCVAAPCRRSELRALSTFATSDAQKTIRPSLHASVRHKGAKRLFFHGKRKKKLSPEEQVFEDTFKLIHKATQKHDRYGSISINKRRSEEMRLAADIRAAEWEISRGLTEKQVVEEQVEKPKMGHGKLANRPPFGKPADQPVRLSSFGMPGNRPMRSPSLTKQAYDASEGQDHEKDLMEITYELGMFVELRRNEISTQGVIVGEKSGAGRLFYTCLMSSGEVWSPNVHDIYFALPPIAPIDLAQRCGTDPIAANAGQQNARVQMLQRIRLVEKALENKHYVVSASAGGLHERLRHHDPNKWGETTVGEVTKALKLKGLISELAVHKFLMNNPINYVAEPGYRTSQKFKVVPKAHIKDLEAVEAWMKLTDCGPLAEFARKARSIIVVNRKELRLEFASAPSWHPEQYQWNTKDQAILRVLVNALRFQRFSQSDPYVIPVSAILKSIDLESPVVKDHELQMTLVELGILAPWQDLIVIQPHLDLDLEPEHISERAKKRNEVVQRGFEAIEQAAENRRTMQTTTTKQLGPEDFYPSDPLEGVRHDFGDMKMYVIDDLNAQELDDGISIERIPLEPGRMWIHVHVADVASVIPPGHIFAIDASNRQETMYFNNRTFPLFPDSLVHSPKHGLSLGSRGEDGAPLRVLTFSFKVDADANLLDHKIRAGLVRNIKITNYDSVDRALGLPFCAHYPFGRPSSATDEETASLSQEEIQDLRDLLAFADAATSQRVKSGTFGINHSVGSVRLGSAPKDMPTWPPFKPSQFSGFPSMDYVIQRTGDLDRGSRSIIAEAAKFACRVTSRFGLERDLPLLRRYSPPFIPNNSTDLRSLLAARSPNGYVEPHIAAKYVAYSQSSTYTLLPKGHFYLCVPEGEGYVRATSPLRRYNDLIVHWQLHHALLGKSGSPPFDDHALERHIVKLVAFESRRKGLGFHHERYWQAMYIHRWMQGIRLGCIDPDEVVGGKNPMDELCAQTQLLPKLNHQHRYEAPVTVPGIGVRGILYLPDNAFDAEIGTEFNVKLKDVKLGIRPMMTFEVKE